MELRSVTREIRHLLRVSRSGVAGFLRSLLFSFDSTLALGVFAAAATALVVHKITIILLHQPLSSFKLFFFWPFLFVLDVITLILLQRALASNRTVWRLVGSAVSLVIVSCSSTFVSLYYEANAEVHWGRSVEVDFPS
jgi:hypothetical protein